MNWIMRIPLPNVLVMSVPGAFAASTLGPVLAEATRAGVQIVLDAWLTDPSALLRGLQLPGVVVLSTNAPDLLARRPLGREIAQLANTTSTDAVLAATATQVLAAAVVTASGNTGDYGRETRDALRDISLPAKDLIVPWSGVRFDKDTFQNEDAAVAAMELRRDEVVTIWSVRGAED